MPGSAEKDRISKLLKKYDRPGPRYTSYPMVPAWKDDFGSDDYADALKEAASKPDRSLSLYLHIPFCRKRCWFCGCNTTALRREETHEDYLNHVEIETGRVVAHLGKRRDVSQFHWGGGTPSCLSYELTNRAYKIFSDRFKIRSDAEISIELDPRSTDKDRIALLKKLGFNRLSFGIQDFSEDVQKAIGRNQAERQAVDLYKYCRSEDFTGINFDLIYGLPGQNLESFKKTIQKTIDLSPDRIALYSFAYIPGARSHQKLIDENRLPSQSLKLDLFLLARGMFIDGGYVQVGMDHFVRPADELARAQKEGKLRRNFMGYTVNTAPDWLGCGMSSISFVSNCFAQNISTIPEYQERIAGGGFAVYRGMKLSQDDLIRQYVIADLMCNFRIDKTELKHRFDIEFDDYFQEAREALEQFMADGLLEKDDSAYHVTDDGKIFIRNIAMAFDAYLKDSESKVQFSRTV